MWTELSFLTEGRGRMGWLMEVFSLEKGGRGSAMLNVKQRDVMESRGEGVRGVCPETARGLRVQGGHLRPFVAWETLGESEREALVSGLATFSPDPQTGWPESPLSSCWPSPWHCWSALFLPPLPCLLSTPHWGGPQVHLVFPAEQLPSIFSFKSWLRYHLITGALSDTLFKL